jgi:alpha-galactosidase
MQVTIIGGGSYQWGPSLMADLLLTPCFADGGHLVLEDLDPAPLAKMEALTHKMADHLGVDVTVSTTTDQRAALDGADFVVVTISTGGFDSMSVDLDVPARHGIRQSVGDSVGPGGINRSLRNIPVLVGIARDMEQVCGDAWMLNITNPMTALTRSVRRETSIRAVGLCHEVGNFSFDLAIALGLPHTAIRPTVSGVTTSRWSPPWRSTGATASRSSPSWSTRWAAWTPWRRIRIGPRSSRCRASTGGCATS